MLDPLAAMSVALDPQSREESNAPLIRFGKRVRWAATHGYNGSTHQRLLLSEACGVFNVLRSLRKNERSSTGCFLSVPQSLVYGYGEKMEMKPGKSRGCSVDRVPRNFFQSSTHYGLRVWT